MNHLDSKNKTMKIKQIAISLFCLMATLKSSSQVFYLEDQAPSALSLSQKGDIKLVVLPPFSKNFNLNLAYSPLKHCYFSIGMLNYFKRESSDLFFQTGNGKKWTGAIGTYYWVGTSKPNTVSKHKNDNGILLDFQMGYSNGKVNNNVNNEFSAKLKFHNAFTRAGIAYRFNYISMAIYYQFNYIQYLDGLVEGGATYEGLFDTALKIQEDPYQYSEFLLQLQLGSKQIKFLIGASGSFANDLEPLLSNKRAIYVGAIFDLDKIFKQLKKLKP